MVNEMHVTKMKFSTNTEKTGRMRDPARKHVAAWPAAGTGKTSWSSTFVKNALAVPGYHV